MYNTGVNIQTHCSVVLRMLNIFQCASTTLLRFLFNEHRFFKPFDTVLLFLGDELFEHTLLPGMERV